MSLVIISLFIAQLSFGQDNTSLADSLLAAYNTEKDPCQRSYLMTELAWEYMYLSADTAETYAKKSVEEGLKCENKKKLGSAYATLGTVYSIMNLSTESIESYFLALEIKEELKDSSGMSVVNNNLGIVYRYMGDYDKALGYYRKSLELSLAVGSYDGSEHHNMSIIYDLKDNTKQAIEMEKQALREYVKRDDSLDIASSYIAMGNYYLSMGSLDTAMSYFQMSEKINRSHKYYFSIGSIYVNISRIYTIKKDYKNALKYAQLGLKYTSKYKHFDSFNSALREASLANANFGNMSKAYYQHVQYIEIKDSLFNEEKLREGVEIEYQYEFEKKHLADSLSFLRQQEIDELAHTISLQKEAQQRYFLYGGLAILIVIGGLIFRGYQRKKKDNILITEQKLEVENQKELVDEKNREITDSLNYAKRIQKAILPADKLVQEYLKESFILYKPKDIVAGDFYWMEHKDGKVLFAAADCTGHGVPGAMVSVICNGALNRSVREFGLTDPAQILGKARDIVIEEFEKSDETVKDGMDIALCSLEGNKLEYAGAHNPLWIIRKGEILETKANKQPIGEFDNPLPYTTHTFELEKGDSLYIFSDGYVDQFGGEKGKKYKTKPFKQLLLSIQDKTMEEQKEIIDSTFESWRGKLEQLDDVCIIGLRI